MHFDICLVVFRYSSRSKALAWGLLWTFRTILWGSRNCLWTSPTVKKLNSELSFVACDNFLQGLFNTLLSSVKLLNICYTILSCYAQVWPIGMKLKKVDLLFKFQYKSQTHYARSGHKSDQLQITLRYILLLRYISVHFLYEISANNLLELVVWFLK